MSRGFYKTQQTYHNYNNFLRDQHNQKRNITTNNYLQRNDKSNYNPIKVRQVISQSRQSPYFSKDAQKKYNLNIPNKPILSGFKKIQNKYVRQSQPHYLQQTATNFNQQNKEKQQPQQRFYDTVTDGFIKNQRPLSKQQPRNKTSTIKEPQEFIESKSHYIQSDAQQIGQQDRFMIQDIENDSQFYPNTNLNERPQTSKGLRKKSNTSQIHFNDEQDLFQLVERPNNKKKYDINSKNLENIPIKSMYPDSNKQSPQFKKYVHPPSAHFAQQSMKKPKNIDDIIKFNVSSIKKLNSQSNLPFQTSIGAEFLSLFANN